MQLEKVTAFVTKEQTAGVELLLFRHPFAGIQLPAGTVEPGESPDKAAIREVWEETGLRDVTIKQPLGSIEETRPGHVFIALPTKVYARPDVSSFDWAQLRRGIRVRLLREAEGFTQVTYEEWDRFPNSQYVTYCISGWVPTGALSAVQHRYLFHLVAASDGPRSWTHFADSHTFEPFWAPLDALPRLVEPQQRWLDYVMRNLGYDFHSA